MKLFISAILSSIIISPNVFADNHKEESKLSIESKGVIVGGATTGIASTVGLSIAGITAVFPLAIIGASVGYLSVKTGKKIQALRKNKDKL